MLQSRAGTEASLNYSGSLNVRHRLGQTLRYQLVTEYCSDFVEQMDAQCTPLLDYVERAFEGYLN